MMSYGSSTLVGLVPRLLKFF